MGVLIGSVVTFVREVAVVIVGAGPPSAIRRGDSNWALKRAKGDEVVRSLFVGWLP